MQVSLINAETKYIMVKGVRFSYRRFGKTGNTPIVFFQHFTGTMDNWDPIVADGIAANHDIIIFNNRGVGSSEGITPFSVQEMADDAIAFIAALGLNKIHLLGFSLGGFIAQLLLKQVPDLIEKVILVGTGPKGGEGMSGFRSFIQRSYTLSGVDHYLFIFYTPSEKSRRIGTEVLYRLHQRAVDRDPESSPETVKAQTQAIEDWALADKNENEFLKNITHPVLVVNGSNDAMFETVNTYELFRLLPNAQLSLYPDSAHASLFQYPELFVEQVGYFLQNA